MIDIQYFANIMIVGYGLGYLIYQVGKILKNNRPIQQPIEQPIQQVVQSKYLYKKQAKIFSIEDIKPLVNNDNLSCNERIQQLKVMLK